MTVFQKWNLCKQKFLDINTNNDVLNLMLMIIEYKINGNSRVPLNYDHDTSGLRLT